MPPPPAEPFASRILLGPALRTQPDRRLVKLVREGYETAFEEIVRRYRKPLDRFAAAIVGGRSEDVTQDAFSKALLALRGSETDIELRPWLYRIVRNTALNDLRDRPPAAEELGEAIVGGRSAAVEAERREEMTELMERLRALPEPQRAAIVMRELEGLSHEEIATALGVSGGAARQAIHRGRVALRNGLGFLVPLPLLRLLFDHGGEAAGAGGAVAAAGVASATGGATLGGLSAGGALKAGVATALVAGSVGAGVAMQDDREADGPGPAAASTAQLPGGGSGTGDGSAISGLPGGPGQAPRLLASSDDSGRGSTGAGDDDRDDDGDDRSGRRDGSSDDRRGDRSGPSGHGGRGSDRSGTSGSDDEFDEDRSGEGASGGSHSGRHGSGGDDDGEGGEGDGGSNSGPGAGSGSSGSGGGSGSSGSGSGDGSTSTLSAPPSTETLPEVEEDSSGSGSGDLDLDDDFDSSGPGGGD